MISRMKLPLRVPFNNDAKQAVLDSMKRVCFIFGPNGSGKTTISQRIADEAGDVNSSVLQWDSAFPVKTYVYNRNFVSKNFARDREIPGVFTMGQGTVDAQKKIKELADKIDGDRQEKEKHQKNLDKARKEYDNIEKELSEICWEIRKEMPKTLTSHWKGTSKKKTCKEDIAERIKTLKKDDALPDINALEDRAAIAFDESVQEVSELPPFDYSALLNSENARIFTKPIVGKDSIAIGDLMKKLGNSDWVAQGRKYITDDVCPFCQQHTVTDELKSDLESFFDESYQTNVAALKEAWDVYRERSRALIDVAAKANDSYADFVDSASLETQIAELKRVVQGNITRMNEKIVEPGRIVTVTSAKDTCAKIANLLEEARNKVKWHNEMVSHRDDEKTKLLDDMRLFAAQTAKMRTVSQQKRELNVQKTIDGLKETIAATEERINANLKSQQEEEKKLTNVKETAEKINDILQQFGFNNFKLSVTEDDRSYRIVRNDGTPVTDTLSEGEASFLTFLYFYYLMNGSLENTGVTDKRVVVIDDPISSMDADVLFVVSSLVRQLAQEARAGNGTTEQMIVLTHNITFHREITYVRSHEGDAQTAYFVIRKAGGYSTIERYDKNPVSSTYEMLWEDLCRTDCNPLTAQNISRRITETFFKLVSIPDMDKIISEMKSPDREIARSFMSWANAGSHSAFDDETFVNTGETIEVYRRALRLFFEAAGYESHYDEMTGRYSAFK